MGNLQQVTLQAFLLITFSSVPLVHGFLWPSDPICPLTNTTARCEAKGFLDIPDELPYPDTLTSLLFQRNNITTLKNMARFPNLVWLSLEFNQISTILPDTFKDSSKLRVLDLEGNKISTLNSSTLEGLTGLEELYLGKNLLTKIDSDMFYWVKSNLRILDLNDNFIKEISDYAFSFLPLRSLHLSRNELTGLDNMLFDGLADLEFIEVRLNALKSIDSTLFQHLYVLEGLDLSHNEIESIDPHAFVDLEKLMDLSINDNQIKKLDKNMFSSLAMLENLHLHNNDLKEFPTFPASVTKITLEGMHHLEIIPNGTFSKLPRLTSIRISYCSRLTTIEAGAFDGVDSSVTMVDFDNNGLKTLDKNLVNWQHLHQLSLGGNAWNCDCKLKWMKELHLPSHAQKNIRCTYPITMQAKTIDELSKEDFICANHIRRGAAIGFLSLLTILLVAVIGVVFYCNRHKLPWAQDGSNYKALYNKISSDDNNAVSFNHDRYVSNKKAAIPEPTPV